MRYEVPCEMIRDLLPSYIDELTSDVTADIIRDHLSSCSDCRRALEDMQGEKFIPDTAGMIKDEKQNIDYLKKVKSRSKRPLWAALALILVLAAAYVYLLVPINIGKSALSTDEKADLLSQVAEDQLTRNFSEYCPDELFANAEFLGIDREGDEGKAYVYFAAAEYAAVDGKAYFTSGLSADAILCFRYAEEGPELTEVIVSEDGEGHLKWIKENYPYRYYLRERLYDPFDADGNNILHKELAAQVEEKMGVPVEEENLIEIKEDGTYEIIKTIETTDPETGEYNFDIEVVGQGSLK